MRERQIVFAVMLALGAILVSVMLPIWMTPSAKALPVPGWNILEGERTGGGYFTIRDQNGKVVNKTARIVHPGDEFIAEDNRRYRITKIKGDEVEAECIGKEKINWKQFRKVNTTSEIVPVEKGSGKNLVAIYTTHSDESYLPTSGTESEPANGDVITVGETLAAELNRQGVEVSHDKTPHEPHDGNAYRRSRRTVVKLIEEGPAAMFDIHRDGVPDPDYYHVHVDGKDVARIRFVVGQQNANSQANLDFAKQLKGFLDDKYPGLVHSIYLAKGNYNQDIAPRMLIVEVGTYTISRELAERGIKLFGEAIPSVLGIASGTHPTSTPGDWSGIVWLLVALIGGGAVFLLISTGSVHGAVEKLKQLVSSEWVNFLGGPILKKKSRKKIKEPTNSGRGED